MHHTECIKKVKLYIIRGGGNFDSFIMNGLSRLCLSLNGSNRLKFTKGVILLHTSPLIILFEKLVSY